jgi:hypothetical protein
MLPRGCEEPRIDVMGFAGLGAREGHRLDVAIVLDCSGSTADPAFDVDGDGDIDSVLEAEAAAARCFVSGLDPTTTRVAVMVFNDEASRLVEFTSDLAMVETELANGLGGSAGGTNFEAAFWAAEDALLDLAALDAILHEAGEESAAPPPDPFRAVVFLTDGITTSHGVPRVSTDSNLTQSSADRSGAIEGARSLGAQTGAQLFAYSILPADERDRARTTLPHCVTACGGGSYQSVADLEDLEASLCGKPLASMLTLTVENRTAGGPVINVPLKEDGGFSVLVPVVMAGDRAADGTYANTLLLTLTASLGSFEQVTTQEVVVRVLDEEYYAQLEFDEIFNAQAASQPVAQAGIRSPNGGQLGNDDLFQYLAGSRSEFEDAVELKGVETMMIAGDMPVEMTVDFVYKGGCYHSDVGYVVIDPARPPKKAAEALAGAGPANVFFNTGNVGLPSCNGESLAAGVSSHQVTVPAGGAVLFFVIPNRTLAQFQADPNSVQPLFTMNKLNPGKFDQALTFRSLAGRTAPGPGGAVVTLGPMVIFAFEDIATASKNSDQDFNDLLFTVRLEGTARPEEASCAEE